ncbi:MAG: hypothetical protein QNJ85_19900 [Gammaproteobacteria bacterium]|nr:hypothetical protein [Gammaproteobacteria bacterium]
MNSKTLQYNATTDSAIDLPALPSRNGFIALAKTVIGWFTRSELEQAQARYRLKRERAAQTAAQRDIVSAMPLEQKQSLGLHRLVD